MKQAMLIAITASIGNFLQGWDNAAISGSLLYMKPEFDLNGHPQLQGIVLASSLIGALLSSLLSGPGADWLGRRSLLLLSAAFYSLGSFVMLWSPRFALIILSRSVVGVGIGISATISPIYIAELSSAEVRGQLSTYPQLMGSTGLLVSYFLCFSLSLMKTPNWRFMLALLLVPSMLFLLVGLCCLPESPRWLVSKGRMVEARKVLHRLRNKNDVAPELALLVEGLGVGRDTVLQEWVLEPPSETTASNSRRSSVLSFPEDSALSWLAISRPAEPLSRHTTAEAGKIQLVDPMVTIIGSLQSVHDILQAETDLEEEKPDDDRMSQLAEFDDEMLKAPLIPRKSMGDEAESLSRQSGRSILWETKSFYRSYTGAESLVPSVGIGGGWQLGWQWQEHQDPQKNSKSTSFKRVYLLQENIDENKSAISLPANGEPIQAAALVGQPAQSSVSQLPTFVVGPAMIHPIQTALPGPAWSDLLKGGVHRALIVGVVLQVLQQLSGINAVLYYLPEVLQAWGALDVFTNTGLSPDMAAILGSGITCIFMLPSIAMAMRLMDQTGRRRLLLTTLPLLLISLALLIVFTSIVSAGALKSAVAFVGLVLYVSIFVMGFGPVPNVLVAEIFPTKVRGVCSGICQVTMWSCSILLTVFFPSLILHIGIAGIFGIFAVMVSLAWIFTLLKVPETKGMPLEVITDFFALSAARPTKP